MNKSRPKKVDKPAGSLMKLRAKRNPAPTEVLSSSELSYLQCISEEFVRDSEYIYKK